MPDVDLFDFFRYALSTVVTIYASVVMFQSLWGWYVWLAGSDKYMTMLRRYVIVHGLRLRFTAFWGDCVICMLLCVAFSLFVYAHWQVDKLAIALRKDQPTQIHVSRIIQQH